MSKEWWVGAACYVLAGGIIQHITEDILKSLLIIAALALWNIGDALWEYAKK